MIGGLKGLVSYIDNQTVLVDVHDVFYRVRLPSSFLQQVKINQEIKVFTYTHVREDVLELFGFNSLEDLKIFELLISVNGIGPKTALGVFSVGIGKDIISAVQQADVRFFSRVPRLGTKNAQKIIIELKSKLGSIIDLDLTQGENENDTDVLEALIGFGFKEKEIYQVLSEVKNEKDSSKKLKLALKYLGK